MPQVAGQAMFEQRSIEAEGFHRQPVVQVETLVHARFEDRHKVAFAEQQAAFVLFHDKAFQQFHLDHPVQLILGAGAAKEPSAAGVARRSQLPGRPVH
ncbi:hypothetical protein D3C76_1461850 [compost metagenome]